MSGGACKLGYLLLVPGAFREVTKNMKKHPIFIPFFTFSIEHGSHAFLGSEYCVLIGTWQSNFGDNDTCSSPRVPSKA